MTINGGTSYGVRALNSEYITINNLALRGSDYNYNAAAQTAQPTNSGAGVDFLSALTSGNPLRGCKVTNCTINGFRTGILFQANQGTFPQTTWRGYTGLTTQRTTSAIAPCAAS